jgi:hypothetical protein
MLGLQQELANNENENLWFNVTLGHMELEKPQQRHKRLVPRCIPNIKKGQWVTNESCKIILHQLLPK